MDNCAHDSGEKKTDEHVHPEDTRFEREILLTDLFHILDLAGKLLNKKEPDQDSNRPFEEFMRYVKVQSVEDKEKKDQ